MNGSISFFVNFVTTMNNDEEQARLMARKYVSWWGSCKCWVGTTCCFKPSLCLRSNSSGRRPHVARFADSSLSMTADSSLKETKPKEIIATTSLKYNCRRSIVPSTCCSCDMKKALNSNVSANTTTSCCQSMTASAPKETKTRCERP